MTSGLATASYFHGCADELEAPLLFDRARGTGCEVLMDTALAPREDGAWSLHFAVTHPSPLDRSLIRAFRAKRCAWSAYTRIGAPRTLYRQLGLTHEEGSLPPQLWRGDCLDLPCEK